MFFAVQICEFGEHQARLPMPSGALTYDRGRSVRRGLVGHLRGHGLGGQCRFAAGLRRLRRVVRADFWADACGV